MDPLATGRRAIERRAADGERRAAEDVVVIEAPLEIRIGGAPYVVVMRTPGSSTDTELVRGLLLAEGLIGAGDHVEVRPVLALGAHERGNVVAVEGLPASAVAAMPAARSMISSSSCGVCGKTSIADLVLSAPVVEAEFAMPASLIASLPGRLRTAQAVFDATGGLHAAGAFTRSGELVAVREDVGRHNAVDKLVGWALEAGRLPAHELVLCVSGRLGYEIAQKAVVAGFPIVAAVSAPSSLAIDLADRHGVALCGFVRGGGFNIYSHPARVT